MPDEPFDVLGLGCVAVDDLLYVPRYPPADAKVQVSRRERQCGGLTATALVTAARLGSRCAFAGLLGTDPESRFIEDALRREGIDVRHVVRRPDARPIHSTVVVDGACATRTIFYHLGGVGGADPQSPAAEVICAARVLFVDHYGIEGMIRATRIARAAGIAVVADFERDDWPGFADLLGLVDHLIISRPFAERLTGHADPGSAAEALWAEGRAAVVVTGGAEGCWYLNAGGAVRQRPAFPVAAVDTTGCGDVFHGAYASGLARGLGLEERLRFAAAAAALKAMHAGIPARAAVEGFLKDREE